jgi:hypothetical protein
MTTPRIDFFYFFGSGYAYLSVMRIEKLAKEAGVTVRWRPFSVRTLMSENNIALRDQPGKMRYIWRDIERRTEVAWPCLPQATRLADRSRSTRQPRGHRGRAAGLVPCLQRGQLPLMVSRWPATRRRRGAERYPHAPRPERSGGHRSGRYCSGAKPLRCRNQRRADVGYLRLALLCRGRGGILGR